MFSVKEYQNVGLFPTSWSYMVTDLDNRPVPESPQLSITRENQLTLNILAAQCNYAFEVGRQVEREEQAVKNLQEGEPKSREQWVRDYVEDGYDKNNKYEALETHQEKEEFIDKALDKMKGSDLLNLISMALQAGGVMP